MESFPNPLILFSIPVNHSNHFSIFPDDTFPRAAPPAYPPYGASTVRLSTHHTAYRSSSAGDMAKRRAPIDNLCYNELIVISSGDEPMNLTRRQRELLDALIASGDWLSRMDVLRAAHTGPGPVPRQMSLQDKLNLERLESAGLIVSRQAETSAPSGFRIEYRAMK